MKNELLNYYQTVEIAALLHDIGKFKFRTISPSTSTKNRKKHEFYSGELVDLINLPVGIDKNLVKNLVVSHHSKSTNIKGLDPLRFADQTSAGMDREEDENSQTYNPLQSIFHSLSLEKREDLNQVKKDFKNSAASYYLPYTLNSENLDSVLFPKTNNKDTNKLVSITQNSWDSFSEKMKAIPQGLSVNNWITTVNSILKLYTSNVVSAAYRTRPTISLYNHLVSTAAIARANAEYEEKIPIGSQEKGGAEEDKYLIINGDINGIQKFIFKARFPSQTRKNASQRLRGRSFFIELLSDAIVRKILSELDLSKNSILLLAAGNFKILAPNTPENNEKILKIEQEVQEYLFSNFNLDLGVSLAAVEVSRADLMDYEQLEIKIQEKIEEKKLRPHSKLLFKDTDNYTLTVDSLSFFTSENNDYTETKQKCRICEAPIPIDQPDNICDNCKLQVEIGRELAKTAYILVSTNKTLVNKAAKELKATKKPFTLLDQHYLFIHSSINDEKFKAIFNIKELDADLLIPDFTTIDRLIDKVDVGIHQYNFALTIPHYADGRIISFDILGKASSGLERIAVMKADVDNLGSIFIHGLSKETDEKRSISRLRDLSMRLDLFFSYYTNLLAHQNPHYRLWYKPCEKHKKYFKELAEEESEESFDGNQKSSKHRYVSYIFDGNEEQYEEVKKCKECQKGGYTTAIYCLFAGGDDMVFIGPWNMIVEFSQDIYNEFKRYVSNNPWITISTGIQLSDINFPISRSLEEAEKLLDESKSFLKYKDRIPLKNSITIFGETVLWEKDSKTYFTHNEASYGDFNYLINAGKEIEKEIMDENAKSIISKRFVYILSELWYQTFKGLSKKEIQQERTKKVDFYPIIAYYIGRRYGDIMKTKKGEEYKKLEKEKHERFTFYTHILPWVRIPASWAHYKTKSRDKK